MKKPMSPCPNCGAPDDMYDGHVCEDVLALREPRGWVVRLGSYLRIFGGRGDAGQPEHHAYIDRMERLAKEREAEHGR